jgi:MFS family permease
VQGVTGGTATNSGLILLPLTLSSVVSSQIGGFFATKTSYRNIMLFSAFVLGIGTFLLGMLTPDTTKWMLTVFMIVAGLGVGFSFSVLGMASIHSFDVRQRGSANSTLAFVRSLGITVGLTIFGIIQRNELAGKLGGALGEPSGGSFGNVRNCSVPKDGRSSPGK